MSSSTTPAEVFLGLGGKVFSLVGLGFVAVGGVYGVNKVSGSAIKVLESLPFWLGMKELKDEDKATAIVTREQLKKGVNAYGSIIAVILAGGAIGMFGRYISADGTIEAANGILYRN